MSQSQGASAPSKSNDIRRLQAAVYDIDALSQCGFSEISGIAKLALVALEHPDGYLHPEIIAQAFSAIWSKAENIENCINSEAEEVGCNYSDQDAERRYSAHSIARQNLLQAQGATA